MTIARDRHVAPHVTLEKCDALQFSFVSREGELPTSVIVWRGGPKNLRPMDSAKRLRDLRSGDQVICFGKQEEILGVVIYR